MQGRRFFYGSIRPPPFCSPVRPPLFLQPRSAAALLRPVRPVLFSTGRRGAGLPIRSGAGRLLVGAFFPGRVLLENVGREDREEQHAERRQQHADDLADGRDGEDLRTDGCHVHPGPPQGVAEAVEPGVDRHLVVVEDQCREVGEDHDGEQVGGEEAVDAVVAHEPLDDDGHGQEGPHEGHHAHDEAPVVRHVGPAPGADVEPRDRDEQVEQVAPQIAPTIPGRGPADEEIREEDEADDKLDREVGLREAEVVSGQHLPGDGGQQDYPGEQPEQPEPTERIARGGFAGGSTCHERKSVWAQSVQNQCQSRW